MASHIRWPFFVVAFVALSLVDAQPRVCSHDHVAKNLFSHNPLERSLKSCIVSDGGPARPFHRPNTVGPNNPTHTTGLILNRDPPDIIGPDSGLPSSSPNTWTLEVDSRPAGDDTKFLVLHFTNLILPGNNRIEVDLNYEPPEIEVFRASSLVEQWTRPINIQPLADNPIIVRYITDGATTGSVGLSQIGIGQSANGRCGSRSNSDPFLVAPTFVEPVYDPFWFCSGLPNWQNVACITDTTDVRNRVARSVGMVIGPTHDNEQLSTCSVTLIDTNKVLTAGHCFDNDGEALASSVTFDYQTDCNGNRPAGYSPHFFKVRDIDSKFSGDIDWCILVIDPPPGVPPLQLRPDLPDPNEEVFGIHHPNGAVKKLSVPGPAFIRPSSITPIAISVPKPFHVSGGSSGSSLFDTAGRVLGVLALGNPCQYDGSCNTDPDTPRFDLRYFPSAAILKEITEVPVQPVETRDVMIVFDRSGSMSGLDSTGRTKIEVARDAVSLFVQLIRKNSGSRIGLVSFSDKAAIPVEFPLGPVDDANKAALIGAPPFAKGIVGALQPSGKTSIGDGLVKAGQQLAAPGTNPRAILLMTDGMENTPPLAESVEVQQAVQGSQLFAVGFGKPENLNGDILTRLTLNKGAYANAQTGVSLQKFFSQAFGNIFEYGILKDPEYDLAPEQRSSEAVEFNICGEDLITVAVGWDNSDGTLLISLQTPSGRTITGSSPGVEQAIGRAWTFLRVPLPFETERQGVWNVTVSRPRPRDPARKRQLAGPALHYFINIIPTGGPRLSRVPDLKAYYTGDVINPLVSFVFVDGSWPADLDIEVSITRPSVGVGNVVTQTGLQAPVEIADDTIPSIQSTLGASNTPITSISSTYTLSNQPEDTIGTFEEASIYGSWISNALTTEGDYTFHVRASTKSHSSSEPSCIYSRELIWSIYVNLGIDPAHTPTTTTLSSADPSSPQNPISGIITFTPSDSFGGLLGPGRGAAIPISPGPGTTITGSLTDNGDGSYSVPIVWDPRNSAGSPPSIIIQQPGRTPVVIQTPGSGGCGDDGNGPGTDPDPGDDDDDDDGGGSAQCALCIPFPGQNNCHATTSCSPTPFGTMCSCRPGYRPTEVRRGWRLEWPVPGHEPRVYVGPGGECGSVCEGAGSRVCQEVGVGKCVVPKG